MSTEVSNVLHFKVGSKRGRGGKGYPDQCIKVKTSDDSHGSAQRIAARTPPADPPGILPGSLPD